MSIPGAASPLFIGAAAADAAAYQIDRSLRFNSGDSAYLNRTPSSAGNRRTFTLSAWIKKYNTNFVPLFSVEDSSGHSSIEFNSSKLKWNTYTSANGAFETNALFRDPGAWYHVVVSYDSTLSTAADRIKCYVNGVEQTFSSYTAPTQNQQTPVNNTVPHTIGKTESASTYGDMGLAETHFVDGQALAATDFGEYDSNNVWQAKEVSVSSINDGTVWSDGWDSTNINSSFPGTNSFDGSLTTKTLPNNDTTATWTPSSGISIGTSLRIYGRRETSGGTLNFNFSDSTTSTITISTTTTWYEVSGAAGKTLTSVVIGKDSSGNEGIFHALEVDGEILIDSYNNSSGYGTNGFHLDFSDNSSNAALGTDSSGNSNTWTVNNISAAGSAWNQSQTWSSSLSSTTGFRGSEPATNAFDGDTSSICSAVDDAVVTFTSPVTFASDSTIRVIVHGGDHTVTVNGGSDQTISAGSYQTVTFTNSSNSTFVMTFQRDTSADTGIRAIEIGGNVLVDSSVVDPNAKNIDSLIDTPTNYTADSGNNGGNYCTLNPFVNNGTLSNGNLDIVTPVSGVSKTHGTIAFPSSGKYYFEVTPTNNGDTGYVYIGDSTTQQANSVAYYADGRKRINGTFSSYGASWDDNDVIGCAVNVDDGEVTFYKNGSSQGTISYTISGKTLFPAVSDGTSNSGTTFSANFGQRPFSISSVPTGFVSLCTTNLPDPTIADGSTAFDTKLWTGNGSTQTISNINHSPDFVWVKQRDVSRRHWLMDTIRGVTKMLSSDSTQQDVTDYDGITAFNSDGFDLDDDAGFNASSGSYVGWTWDAGTSTVSNTDGSITSNVRANQSAGFSVATYTSPNSSSDQSFGHGLNAKPDFVLVKNRDSAYNWDIYHSSLGYNASLIFTNAATRSGAFSAEPTSSVVNTKNDYTHSGTDNYVAYCWTAVEGYSAFGSYEGNGSSGGDGPFVYTGMRPRWIIVKNADDGTSASDWFIYDTARSTFNAVDDQLYPNRDIAEAASSTHAFDILSNGFKVRSTSTSALSNKSANTYIYAAFSDKAFSLNGGLAR